MIERDNPFVDQFTSNLITDATEAAGSNDGLKTRLVMLEQNESFKVYDMMIPPGDAMFILHQLAEAQRENGLGQDLPKLAKSFKEISTEEKPEYQWWVDFGLAMRADCIKVLGDIVLVTEFGRQVNETFMEWVDSVNSEHENT